MSSRPEPSNSSLGSGESPAVLSVSRSRLVGEVRVSGAKNSALRLLAASVLTSEPIELTNYPSGISDAVLQVEMLQHLGKHCEVRQKSIRIKELSTLGNELEWSKRSIRNTLLLLGSLVSRTGFGRVPLPGGCRIGSAGERAFDLHVMLLEALGARVAVEKNGFISASAQKRLVGADIHLPIRSTGATENSILASTLAKGTTTVWNPHIRPEILDLITMLRKMGADIEVYGQERIVVTGTESLSGATHEVVADNVEALTWLVGAAITGGEVEIHGFPFSHLEVPLVFLRESGAKLYRGDNSLVVRGGPCFPIEISTGPYPGINSDMQPLFAVFGANARGVSKFIDLRFPGRYQYAEELAKMGLSYDIIGNLLEVRGGPLQGAGVCATDLRAGVALALAGMSAEGTTHIHDGWQITRGYDSFLEKCQSLGGRVYWSE